MNYQVFGSTELIAAIVKYQFNRKRPYPVKVDDLIIFDHNPELVKLKFEEWLDLYFEYVQYGPDTYRITGILNKNLGK
jgi:hypothetical protein